MRPRCLAMDDEVGFVEAVQQHSWRRMFHRYISSNVLITSQVFKHPLLWRNHRPGKASTFFDMVRTHWDYASVNMWSLSFSFACREACLSPRCISSRGMALSYLPVLSKPQACTRYLDCLLQHSRWWPSLASITNFPTCRILGMFCSMSRPRRCKLRSTHHT